MKKLKSQKVTATFKQIPSSQLHRISNKGVVINERGLTVKPYLASKYLCIKLKRPNKIVRATRLIHRLVWEAFREPIEKGMWVNHKDGNKLNNHIDNLEVGTPSYNHCHARDVLKRKYVQGAESAMRKLSSEGVEVVKLLYAQGWSQAKIARAFDVSAPCISYIISGKTWKKLIVQN